MVTRDSSPTGELALATAITKCAADTLIVEASNK